MRTNIVINESLINEAFKYTDVSSKRELIDLALREFIIHHRRKDVRDLKGRIQLREDYDHKKLRSRDLEE